MQISEIRQCSLITAIKTPFDSQGNIDLTCFDLLVEEQIKAGVDGLIIGGTTGEGHLLDWSEHLMLIAHSASKYGDRLLIIGNTGSNSTREAIKATKYGFASGMHAALQITPYYGKTTQAGAKIHLQKALDGGPAFIYNVPGRTGHDIEPEVMRELAQHENFIGVKECAGMDRIKLYESEGIPCWSGNDDESFTSRHRDSSHGVISVTSNLLPRLMRQLMDQDDDALNQQIQPLMQWLFCEPNPICLNTAMAMLGAIEPVFRLPYLPLSQEQQQQGLEILKQLPRQELPGDKLALIEQDQAIILP